MTFLRNGKVALLEQVPLFDGCSHQDLTYIAKLASELQYDDGALILHQGVAGHEFLVLVEGDADVQIGGKTVNSIHAGDYVGEISLLEQTRRTASVVARGRARALVLDEEGFEKMLAKVPAIRSRVNRGAFERLAGEVPEQPAD